MFFFPFIYQLEAKSINYTVVFENIISPPSNDDCANAIDLTVNQDFLCANSTAGTVVDATASSAPSGCPGLPANANDDVWFKFTATSVSHKVELLNVSGNQTDLYHMIFDGGASGGNCGTMTPIFCSDPEVSSLNGLTVGNTYFIRVFTNSPAVANTIFDICVGTSPAAPSNDDCANAEAISLPFTPATYDATGATNAGFITATGCIDMNDGVWYTLLGDGGNITLTVSPDSWDAAVVVYEDACGNLVCVDDSNIGTVGVVEAVTFPSILNKTYRINIAYPSGTIDQPEGVFDLDVTSSTLSLDDIITKGFYYYPNPVTDILKLNANELITQVSLYSILGKEIKKVKQSDLNAEIDFSSLPSGAYFVRAIVGGSSGAFKIIKI